MKPYRVRVFSSYLFTDDDLPYAKMGEKNQWVNGFVRSLVRNKSGLEQFDLQFTRTPSTPQGVRDAIDTLALEGLDLIICPGTDSAIQVARVEKKLPIVYFGAHPENNGIELITQPNVTGIRLSLPMIWNWPNFALLRDVMPRLQRVYVPVNLNSEFAFPNVRANYALHRRAGGGPWIDGTSSYIGYRGAAFLAERLGVTWHECPYDGADELQNALEMADSSDALFVGFNDTILDTDAVGRLVAFVGDHAAALGWVNNAALISHCGVIDYSSDFERVGRLVGDQVVAILRDGTPIGDIPFAPDPGQRLSLNLRRCQALGLEVSAEARGRFDEVFE